MDTFEQVLQLHLNTAVLQPFSTFLELFCLFLSFGIDPFYWSM
jgi:hypothetical protein